MISFEKDVTEHLDKKNLFVLPFLALTLCSPIGGAATIFISLFFYILEMLYHTNYCVWFHYLPTTLDWRVGKII